MKFMARCSTDDGRLTAYQTYIGGFVTITNGNSLRIVVYDNMNEWMTFDPKVFEPVDDEVSFSVHAERSVRKL